LQREATPEIPWWAIRNYILPVTYVRLLVFPDLNDWRSETRFAAYCYSLIQIFSNRLTKQKGSFTICQSKSVEINSAQGGAKKVMATIRPYFKLSISDLESIFEAAHSEKAICQALVDELSHRSTDRAATLLKKIQKTLKEVRTEELTPSSTLSKASAPSNPLPQSSESASPPARTSEPLPANPVQRTQPQKAAPAVTNKPANILSAWTALEALSPQTYRRPADLANGDTRCVAEIDGNELPWLRGERSRPKQQLYYQVILGSVFVDRATDELIKAFGEDEERGRKEREKAALAAVLVDRNGMLLEENAVAISSFGWALPIALTGDLAGLGAWTTVERGLVDELTKKLTRKDSNGDPMPLDMATLQKAFLWLIETLKLPSGLYEEPSFVLRVFHYFKSKNPPEVALLNSFFLEDLGRASKLLQTSSLNPVLQRYLGAEHVPYSPNLLETPALIEELIAPAITPATRWPAPGGHPLVTLQQAAVNAAKNELAGSKVGIVAVNGPPGTGKTTLLRDVVASCVFERASAMARFDDPTAAFKTTGQKIAAGDRAFLHLYSLDGSLKGHEVLVASSNNKAVENVSKELPALKAIGREFAYFKTISDQLLSTRSDDGEVVAGEPTWGLIAAVLGNAQNRYLFQQALWWDDDRSLRLYLKAAKGDSVVREVTDDSGRVIDRKVPKVIEEESPPSPEEAKVNWHKARTRFTALQKEVETSLRALETVRQTCLKLSPSREAARLAQEAFDSAASEKARLDSISVAAMNERKAAEARVQTARQQKQQALVERPGWLHRLFNTQRMQRWKLFYAPLGTALVDAENRSAEAIAVHKAAEQRYQQADLILRGCHEKVATAQAALATVERAIDQHRHQLGNRLVDELFFAQGHEKWNLTSPWLPDTLHQKREELFEVSLQLHRAFIDAAAQKISHNLGVLMGAMQVGALREEAKKSLLGDLWSTLFLVCPVVSTTFASVNRMLGDLPSSSFGWVLVDEAGQATPQSAVGLLMRAQKAIIVGDPLQIPPVVSLPQRLVTEVAKYFGVSPAEWLAPDASVQTLADQASRLKAEFRADVGVRSVGLPLLVHRRCQEPMFGISNRIAYDGQMVHAAGRPSAGPVTMALGASRWFDINAPAESKWCPAEGEVVVQLLSHLVKAGVRQPDIYVITPFRIVAQELRRRIKQERGLLQSFDVDEEKWLRDRVGTIHTFQGKEAEAVIAVLGAPLATQQGTRRWAASTP